MSDYTMKAADTQTALQATLKNPSGSAVDLSGDVTVQFRMRARGSTSLTVDKEATISSATGGVVLVAFTTSESATAGGYQGEFFVTFVDGRTETYPNSGYISVTIVSSLG